MEILAQYKGPLSEGIIIKIEVKLKFTFNSWNSI